MSTKTFTLSEELHRYLVSISLRESPVMRRLREETGRLAEGTMQISPEQGAFMALLAKSIGAVRALEIGTFTGYSALAVALALPPGGRLIACDRSEEWTAVARKAWVEAGVADRIELRLGDAAETLRTLEDAGSSGTIDFAFIDADRMRYRSYYESCLRLARPGALILIDNVLRNGKVIDPLVCDGETEAVRALNDFLVTDDRIDLCVVPIGDGVTVARKR